MATPIPSYIVVALDQNNGIGKNGDLPWRLKKEIRYFKELTTHTEDPDKINMLIMGRTTWESIPEKFRPLPGRKNIVLTRSTDYQAKGAETANSYQEALNFADENIEKVFIIGGAEVFNQALQNENLSGLYITHILKEYDCDTFFPEIPEAFKNHIQNCGSEKEQEISYEYYLYQK